jgi:hypothetical protein
LIAGAILVVLWHTGLVNLAKLSYPCLFYRLSGVYCPGCGGTRSVKALLDGHFLLCLYYHPFVFYCFVMYVWFMLSQTLERLSLRRNPRTEKSSHKKFAVRGLHVRVNYVYIGILILLLQWALKNVALILFRNLVP